MSDISKKIFSIEPEPDEDPIALVPDPVEVKDITPLDPVLDTGKPSLLRSVSGRAVTSHRPIFELVHPVEDEPEDMLDDEAEDDQTLVDTEAVDTPIADTDIDEPADVKLTIEPDEPEDILLTDQHDEVIIRPLADHRSERTAPQKEPESLAIPPAPAPDPISAAVPAAQLGYVAPSAPEPARLGWVGPVLAIATGIAIGALIFAYMSSVADMSVIGLTGLVLAVIVPMATVIALWATLRALRASRAQTMRLAEVADRLTRADEAVTADVARMSSAIRRELAQVDSRLAQSRDEIETLAALISRQSTELNGMTQRLADRSETVSKTVTEQRDAFVGLSSDFDARMSALTQSIDTHREALEQSGDVAAQRIGDASEALNHATQLTTDHTDAIATAATKANSTVIEAEARLSALSERIKAQAEELDAFYERRTAQLSDMSARLSDEKALAETALYSQTEKLGAVDAQLEITESRLTALLDHAAQAQTQLTARLSDIDSTLSNADQRSRAFTADIADRVSDSVAQTRREISIMEGELRALQSRMDGVKSAGLPLEPTPSPDNAPSRIHLKPLDTDFPSLSEEDLEIPETDDDDTLDLISPISDDAPSLSLTPIPSEPDLVRRPGGDGGGEASFGRGKSDKPEKNWRWRDMLGTIEPITETMPAPASQASPKPAPMVQRPGPGVPLSPPSKSTAEKRIPQPEGSDVVARLCEVKLPPSRVVDDEAISAAEAARKSGGEAAQSDAVFSRLNAPVIHLRGVLSADLEFRLRAEGFRRSYHGYLNEMSDPTRLHANLSTADGRAYLLCAAALSAS